MSTGPSGDVDQRSTVGRGPLVSYAGRAAVLATKHDKLPLVAPPLAAVGLEVVAVEVDTDRLGTFTGEVPRPGPPRDTAIAKARLAKAATGIPLGLASEGSIGPHPASPLLTVDVELVVLVDDDRDVIVWAAVNGTDTFAATEVVDPGQDPTVLAAHFDLPHHAVIVRPNQGPPAPVFKGLRHPADTNARVLRRATRRWSHCPRRSSSFASRPPERLAAVGPQPLRLGAAVATVWGLVPHTAPMASPAQVGALARRLHDATEGGARDRSAHIFNPIGAIHSALGEARRRGAPTGAIGDVATRALRLEAAWAAAAQGDPLGCALVHGDLHAGNIVPAADGPVLVDLELCGIGPRSYDLAPAAVAARRYGAPASDVDLLVDGYGDDPRGWVGFETFCQVYELWATAWALSQPEPEAVAEGVVRAAALGGTSGRPWQLR